LTITFGVIAIAVAVHALGRVPAPSTLDPTGGFADDGWSRSCRAAVLLVTGLTAVGLVRAPGLRRIAALLALLGAGAGVVLAAWAPFHLALPELWGEGSAPLAGWHAIVWPWAGWSVLVRLSGGLAPALEEWGFDGVSAVSVFLVLGALLPGAAALAEERLGR